MKPFLQLRAGVWLLLVGAIALIAGHAFILYKVSRHVRLSIQFLTNNNTVTRWRHVPAWT